MKVLLNVLKSEQGGFSPIEVATTFKPWGKHFDFHNIVKVDKLNCAILSNYIIYTCGRSNDFINNCKMSE